MTKSKRVVLGRITGAHGIQGEVKLQSFTSDPEAIAGYGPLDSSAGGSLSIKSLKPLKGGFRARLDGVDDRNAAEALKGVELSISRDRLPEADEDEVYHADLIGLAACDRDGKPLGEVVAVLDFGAGELLELKLPSVKATVLVPFNVDAVPEIDLDTDHLVINPPEGLLEN